MILHLLTFGRRCTKNSSTGKLKIGSLIVIRFVNEKIFLFCSYRRNDCFRYWIAENFHDPPGLVWQGLHGPEQRGFFVKGFTVVGIEGCGNIKGHSGQIFSEKGRRCGIPDRISSGFKCWSNTAGWEWRSIRFTLNQLLPGKFHNNPSGAGIFYKRLMFFCRYTVHGLKPVRIMGGTLFDSPFHHGTGNLIGNIPVQGTSFFNSIFQFQIDMLRKTLFHHVITENMRSIYIRYCLVLGWIFIWVHIFLTKDCYRIMNY